jgi:chromosome segregation ATPase
MSIEDQKIDQISQKISELIALKNQKQTDIERLLEENKSLKEEKEVLEKQYSSLEMEVENLKTIDGNEPLRTSNLDEVKINGMIKEIEECLTLLKS